MELWQIAEALGANDPEEPDEPEEDADLPASVRRRRKGRSGRRSRRRGGLGSRRRGERDLVAERVAAAKAGLPPPEVDPPGQGISAVLSRLGGAGR